MSPPRLTVVICTRNRADDLAGALESLTACEHSDLCWEVLVVDNGSSDHTHAVLDAFTGRLPLRRAFEPQPGLSAARNRGISEAVGDYLCWIDDDVRVPTHYLQAYAQAISADPRAAVFGGPILPVLSPTAPVWLRKGLDSVAPAYAARPASLANNGAIRLGKLPYGANFVLRADVAARFPFCCELGRSPDRPVDGGEELDIMRRILQSGEQGRWVRDAVVEHHIQPERETQRWLHSYFFASGRSVGDRQRIAPVATRLARGINACCRAWAHRLFLSRLGSNDQHPRRARHLQQAAWHAGYLHGLIHSASKTGAGGQ